MNTIAVVATATAKPGHTEELRAAFTKLLGPSRSDKGCLVYDLHQSTDDPDTFMMYEVWASKAELDAHLATPHLQEFGESVADILAGDLNIATYSPVDRRAAM